MKRISLVALGVAALALVAVLYAQMPPPAETVQIPFDFSVGAKVLPAGQYRVLEGDPGMVLIERLGPSKTSVFAPILTRLAAQPNQGAAQLVFDKIGNSYTLSEVWFAGFDGYLIATTTQKHEHAIVKKG